MSEYSQDLRRFVVENFLFGQDEGLTNDTSFIEAGIVDSTGILELVAHLQRAYGVEVKDDELIPENLDSINSIAAYVENKLL